MESEEDIILEEAFKLTEETMNNFVMSQNLNIVQLIASNVKDLKSYCQGYFNAMFVRNVTVIAIGHHKNFPYEPPFHKYEKYHVKICNHPKFLKLLSDLN